MTTLLIPELIEPGNLYVPANYNNFNVASGVLPNGDDALEMLGASGGDCRSYQPAIADIHYRPVQDANGTQDPWSLAMWLDLNGYNAGGGSNNPLPQSWLCGVTTVNDTNSSQWTTNQSYNPAWICSGTSATQTIALGVPVNTSGNTRRFVQRTMDINATGQNFLVWSTSDGISWSSWLDGISFGTTTAKGAGTGVRTYTDPMNFGIGCPSQVAGPRSLAHDIVIAKVAIFMHELDVQDVLDLQDSMLNGPPSP